MMTRILTWFRMLAFALLVSIPVVSYADDTATVITITHSLDVRQIQDDVWLHTSYTIIAGHRFPSNGLLVKTDDGLVMVDTAWSEEDTIALLSWIEKEIDEKISVAIITHAHDDRMIGLAAVHAAGIPSMALDMTVALAREQGKEEPRGQFRAGLGDFQSGRQWELFYPGPGHVNDNIVVYFPGHKLLFGGCLVRANTAEGLGYVIDSDLDNWDDAVKAVAKRFPDADVVVPGHGEPGGRGLLSHTLTLLDIRGGEDPQ